jgi:hypothetical protein
MIPIGCIAKSPLIAALLCGGLLCVLVACHEDRLDLESPFRDSKDLCGKFYLEKSVFAQGEPIFLYFQVINNGPKAEDFRSGNGPYHCFSDFGITVSSDPAVTQSCEHVYAGSCLQDESAVHLQPAGKYTERVLLNFEHEIAAPGEYSVEASHRLGPFRVHATISFRVGQNSIEPGAFRPWVDQLRSTDPTMRVEAARTLASLAPRSEEETLLLFANNREFSEFAPLAMHRLNTPRSMAAMADLLKRTGWGTFEHMESAEYVAESGDQQWFPLLLEIAEKHSGNFSYVADAAELGGDKILPTLVALAGSPNKKFTARSTNEDSAQNAVAAMGYTGSRAAVPILVRYLKSPDVAVAESAREGLRLLTHRTANDPRDDRNENPQSQYRRWSQWWASAGATAAIYTSTECSDFIPLP